MTRKASQDKISVENKRIWINSKKSAKIASFNQTIDALPPLRSPSLFKIDNCHSSVLRQPPGVVTYKTLSAKAPEDADCRSGILQAMGQNRSKLRINGSKTTEQSGSLCESMRYHYQIF